ncbi:MAG: polysaccharide deacetylase family protein, partial [Acutalibacteraceae bacterium]|nr:polysaccharide deacetylase family protein [Acutalibacteraceae bacterium]
DTHAAFSKISREEIKQEILNCNKKIEAITGVSTKLVRAPSGDYNNKSIEVAESLDMKMIQWDCDTIDIKVMTNEYHCAIMSIV